MAIERALTRMAVTVVAIALTQALVASPVLAEGESDCVCIVAGGTSGVVTGATGWVKLNGDVGLVDATMNAPLSVGSVMRTGAAGSATATVGAGCSRCRSGDDGGRGRPRSGRPGQPVIRRADALGGACVWPQIA